MSTGADVDLGLGLQVGPGRDGRQSFLDNFEDAFILSAELCYQLDLSVSDSSPT